MKMTVEVQLDKNMKDQKGELANILRNVAALVSSNFTDYEHPVNDSKNKKVGNLKLKVDK